MITTLTLNPAIDRTLIVEGFKIDTVNRVKSLNIDAGGKGINASKIIKALGVQTTALGFLGGDTGKEMTNILDKDRLCHDFVWVEEKTRTNIKVVDIKNNTCTDINEPGPYISPKKLEELKLKIKKHANKSHILVFSGNAQQSIPVTIYKDIMQSVNNKKMILDAGGMLLKEGIKAKPWLIKPNVQELAEILNTHFQNTEQIIIECRKLNENGIKYICVSMGADGLLLVTKEKAIMAKPPKVIAKSTVGAGDSVVGSLAVSFYKNEQEEEALKRACAISAATVTLAGTEVPKKQTVQEIYKNVTITIL